MSLTTQCFCVLTDVSEGLMDSQCTSGFISPDRLTALLAGEIGHRNMNGRQWVFPGMSFTSV